jgi:hypothetical protein
MNFTPETWRYESGEVIVSGRGCIARIPTPQAGGVFECVANGKLIAAAPELYDALAALTACISETRGKNADAALHIAHLTLAKARGEA